MAVSRRYVAFFLLLFVQSAMAARGDRWNFGVDVSVLSDDNVTRAQGWDVEKDLITRADVNARYSLNFSLNRALIFTGHLLDERYRDFDGVSSAQAGLEAEYRFRTHAGFTAPVYSFYISGTQADYKTDIRDGSVLEYGLRVRRRFTDRIAVVAGAGQYERTADGRVFDLEHTQYFAYLDYRVTNRFQAYLAYYYIDGDTYSISSVAPAVYGGGYAYDAVERDPAFSEVTPHWAYRVDARTDVVRLGFNISIDRDNSIDISVDDIGSEASNSGGYGYGYGGNAPTYDTTVVAVGYFHRF